MRARHFSFLVEEPSMQEFLQILLPRILPEETTFEVHSFGDKMTLRRNLQDRLRGYARWLPNEWRILVVLDRDGDDCHALKRELEAAASAAGLQTRSVVGRSRWQVVNRIAIEELEAWYFGDWQAVCDAYPRVPATLPQRAGFRDPDDIRGGTWEAFETVLQRHGYFATGLRKVEAARTIAARMRPARSRSRSFEVLVNAILEAAA